MLDGLFCFTPVADIQYLRWINRTSLLTCSKYLKSKSIAFHAPNLEVLLEQGWVEWWRSRHHFAEDWETADLSHIASVCRFRD